MLLHMPVEPYFLLNLEATKVACVMLAGHVQPHVIFHVKLPDRLATNGARHPNAMIVDFVLIHVKLRLEFRLANVALKELLGMNISLVRCAWSTYERSQTFCRICHI